MTAPDISTLGEAALIERLRRRVRRAPDFVTLGIGDDCAIIEPPRGAVEVVTTDSLVEGIHFRREWTSARAIGHKALAVNLSDLAAMGATPRAVLLSLILPSRFPIDDFDALVDGFVTLADQVGVPLVGGNLAASPAGMVVDVTALGSVGRRRVLRRDGGRPGDDLFLTGRIGGAAAGLAILAAGRDRASVGDALGACIDRYEQPTPRLRFGQIVARTGASRAAIDLSDGLATAARQLAEASRTGVVIDAEALPLDEGATLWAAETNGDPIDLAIRGGEDYELLIAVSPRQSSRLRGAQYRTPGLPVTRVGQLTRAPGAWLDTGGGRIALREGFTHF